MEDYYSKADRIFEERKLKELFPEPEPIQTHPDLIELSKKSNSSQSVDWLNCDN